MQVRNTFLCFDDEKDLESPRGRRSSSIPPTARLSPTASYSRSPVLAARTPSPVRSECDLPLDFDRLPMLVQQLVQRPAVAGVTTIMVRNVPNKYTQRLLLRAWKQMGYGNAIDLFYLPMDFRNKCNLGYCFINFTTPEFAAAFRAEVDGIRLTTFKTNKVLVTAEAHIQGFLPNFTAFRNSAVMGKSVAPEYQPLICDPASGKEVTIPRPCTGSECSPRQSSVDATAGRLLIALCTAVDPGVAQLVVAGLVRGFASQGRTWELSALASSIETDRAALERVVKMGLDELRCAEVAQ